MGLKMRANPSRRGSGTLLMPLTTRPSPSGRFWAPPVRTLKRVVLPLLRRPIRAISMVYSEYLVGWYRGKGGLVGCRQARGFSLT